MITTTCPKHSRTTDPNYFAVETAGLRWLADAGSGSARVVGVLEPTSAGADLVERVCERLIAGEFDDGRPPARITVILWAGNLIFMAEGVVLIDPAAHGGHGLIDLAMLHLFGPPELALITAEIRRRRAAGE